MSMHVRRAILLVVFALTIPSAIAGAQPAAEAPQVDPRIQKLLTQISPERLKMILTKLGSFGTRSTLSSTDSTTQGIGAARQWIYDEMKRSSSRLQVSFDTYQVQRGGRITRDIELRNVMAVLPGKSPRRIYVSAHYDSFARAATPATTPAAAGPPASQGVQRQQAQPAAAATPPADNPAPGVNDDGSGVALVMELARVFAESGLEFDPTLVFITFAGEEQGLLGSRNHAQKAAANTLAIDAVLNNDMVGNIEANGMVDADSIRVFSESPEDSPSRGLARYISRAAAMYVPAHHITLIARYDRFGRGGDHTPFNQNAFPAVRITEANENFSRQHTTVDTIEGVSLDYLLKNVKVNGATLANLALAPPAPAVAGARGLDRNPSGYDAHLRWTTSPGAVAYRVFWRQAWTPDWQHELNVGNATEFTSPGVSIDDYVFGVAAIGPGGNESLVSVYVNPQPAPAANPSRAGTER
jgi:hypothetical protein